MTAARTSRVVKRPKTPPTSERKQQGDDAAGRHLTTLAEHEVDTGRSVLIHGETNSGKTVLAIHKADRPILVLDCDNGLDSVYGTTSDKKVQIWGPVPGEVEMTWKVLEDFRSYLLAGHWQLPYKAIVVDNVTAAQKPLIRWAIDQAIARASDGKRDLIDPDIPSQQSWGKIYRVFDQWIRDIISVKRRGVHIIFTAGTREWLDDNAGFTKLMPNLEGQVRNQISSHFDAVGFLESDEEGRRLSLAPSGATITKVRLPVAKHKNVPDTIKNPDFKKMMVAVAGLPETKEKDKKTMTRKPKATERKTTK